MSEERRARIAKILSELPNCRKHVYMGVDTVWANHGDVPPVGTRVCVTFNGFGNGTVVGHKIQDEYFLMLLVKVDKIPKSFKQRGHSGIVHASGTEYRLLEDTCKSS